jgi:hypothetical protein
MKFLRRTSKAQALPLVAMLLVAFIGLLGLALDLGRLYVARTELSRAIDSAALAGVIELPNIDAAQDKAETYLEDNQPDAIASFPATDGSYQLRVKGTRTVPTLFMSVFGIGSINIDATATAGYGVVPVDSVIAIDATGSMGAAPACNSNDNNSGCPIWEAKNAASAFVDVLLDGGSPSDSTLIGINPFRGCYNPPRTNAGCVPGGWVIDLSGNQGLIDAKITDIQAQGGTGTNVCLGLNKANSTLFGAGAHTEPNTLRFIIILTDGDNTYNAASYGNGEPPTVCRPTTSPQNSDGDVSSNCTSAQTRERQLDTKTKTLADSIKATDVEIYVVGFGVCGSSNTNLCNTSLIGGTSHDNTADRNLLKCIASSSSATNDHYFEVANASLLPDVFEQIASAIAFRLVE